MFSGQGIINPQHQQGLALLLFVLAVALAFVTYVVSELSIHETEYKQQEKTMASLKKAKQALLAYAMNYPEMGGVATQGPGNFPCPAEEDGVQENTGPIGPGSSCNPALFDPGAIGRLPWKTLEIEELKDGSGEHLWYAISKNYAAVAYGKINTSTIGQITVKNKDGSVHYDGTSIDAVIAVIIAPGEALVRDDGVVQNRATDAERLDPINYLDIAFAGDVLEEDNANYLNANVADGFIYGPVYNIANQLIVNDQVEVITYEDIMQLVHARAANDIGNVIKQYFVLCGAFPDAADFKPFSGGPAYDSVLGNKKGMLPVDSATPLEWDTNHPLFCNLTGVKFPQWVAGEEWHLNSYYEYAHDNPGFPPPPNATDCATTGTCLTVTDMPAPNNNKEAILVFAGRALDPDPGLIPPLIDQTRTSDNLDHYFEAENNTDNLIFDLTPYDTEAPEDYIWVIRP